MKEGNAKAALPANEARCPGMGDDVEGWREGCEDCRRRTDTKPWPFVVTMAPPPIIAFECERRIGERE